MSLIFPAVGKYFITKRKVEYDGEILIKKGQLVKLTNQTLRYMTLKGVFSGITATTKYGVIDASKPVIPLITNTIFRRKIDLEDHFIKNRFEININNNFFPINSLFRIDDSTENINDKYINVVHIKSGRIIERIDRRYFDISTHKPWLVKLKKGITTDEIDTSDLNNLDSHYGIFVRYDTDHMTHKKYIIRLINPKNRPVELHLDADDFTMMDLDYDKLYTGYIKDGVYKGYTCNILLKDYHCKAIEPYYICYVDDKIETVFESCVNIINNDKEDPDLEDIEIYTLKQIIGSINTTKHSYRLGDRCTVIDGHGKFVTVEMERTKETLMIDRSLLAPVQFLKYPKDFIPGDLIRPNILPSHKKVFNNNLEKGEDTMTPGHELQLPRVEKIQSSYLLYNDLKKACLEDKIFVKEVFTFPVLKMNNELIPIDVEQNNLEYLDNLDKAYIGEKLDISFRKEDVDKILSRFIIGYDMDALSESYINVKDIYNYIEELSKENEENPINILLIANPLGKISLIPVFESIIQALLPDCNLRTIDAIVASVVVFKDVKKDTPTRVLEWYRTCVTEFYSQTIDDHKVAICNYIKNYIEENK